MSVFQVYQLHIAYIKATRYMHLYDYAYSWLIYLIRLFTIFMLFSSPGYQSKNYHFNNLSINDKTIPGTLAIIIVMDFIEAG